MKKEEEELKNDILTCWLVTGKNCYPKEDLSANLVLPPLPRAWVYGQSLFIVRRASEGVNYISEREREQTDRLRRTKKADGN